MSIPKGYLFHLLAKIKTSVTFYKVFCISYHINIKGDVLGFSLLWPVMKSICSLSFGDVYLLGIGCTELVQLPMSIF